MLTDEEVILLTEHRNKKLKLEAWEFAYDSAVREINRGKLILDFLGIALAIIFLFILYVLKDQSSAAHDIVSVIGTSLSLLVIICTIWRYIAKWDEQAEKKTQISSHIHGVINQYENALDSRPVSSDNFSDCRATFSRVERLKKDPLATLRRKHLKLGHQHVAIKYSDLGIKCQICKKVWKPEFAKRRKWTNIIPFIGCDGCGV